MSDGYGGRRLSKTIIVREATGIQIHEVPVTEESRRDTEETLDYYRRLHQARREQRERQEQQQSQ